MLLGAGALSAQQPARIDIQAPSNRVISGQTVEFQAVVRDGTGNVLRNAAVTWSANNPMVAVDPQGRVTGRSLGGATVFAQSGNARTGMPVSVLPLRIDISPARAEMLVGEQLQLNATVVDFNGETMNVPITTWELTGANGGQINAASITQSGVMNARGVGRITVRAVLRVANYASPTEVNRIWGIAVVNIGTPRNYRLRRLLSADDVRHSFTLRPATFGPIAVNDGGQVAFVGSLDGLTSALMVQEQGRTRVIAAAGQPDLGNNNAYGLRDTPGQPSINNSGDVLTTFRIQPGGQALAQSTQNGLRYLLLQGQSFGDFEGLSGFQIHPQSLNDSGLALFSANFRNASSGQNRSGLFRTAGRSFEIVHTNDMPLPGITGAYQYQWFGQDNDGTVHFIARTPTSQVLFRRQGFAAPERLIGTGDVIDGGRVGFLNAAAAGRRGGVAVAAGDFNWAGRLVWFRGAQREIGAQNANGNGIYWAEPSQGVLLNTCGQQGCGLYRFFEGRYIPVLIQGRLAPNEEPIQNFNGAGMTAGGEVIAQVSTSDRQFVVIRPGAANPLLIQDGARVDVTAGPHFRCCGDSILRGAGQVYVQLGNPISVWEIAGRSLIPRILTGDRLPGGSWLATGAFLSNPDGDIAFPSSGAVYRWREGRLDQVAANGGATEDGRQMNNIGVFALTDNGSVTFETHGGGIDRVYQWRDGQLTRLLDDFRPGSPRTQFGGVQADSWNTVSADDQGRILIAARYQGRVTGYVLYENGRWQPLMIPLTTQIAGKPMRDLTPLMRGGRIYGVLNHQICCENVLAEWDGGEWSVRVASNTSMPNGAMLNNISGGGNGFDANRRGDLVFTGSSPGGQLITVRLAGGESRAVYRVGDTTDEGDILTQVNELQIRDDGSVYFAAFDVNGNYVLYAADPL